MKTLLVIEDEEDYQDLVRRILEPAGFRLRLAATGEEALRWLERNMPDAAILDINLPDVSGYDVCHRIRLQNHLENLPVLMLTVRRRPDEWLRGFEAGADDYLPKPLEPDTLVERVRALLQTAANQREQQLPEQALIRAAQRGNRSAFTILLEQHQPRLYDSLLLTLRNPGEAEEVMAEAFARAYAGLAAFERRSSFYTWLYRIAYNLVIERCRQNRGASLEDLFEDEKPRVFDALVERPSFAQPLLQDEQRRLVRQVLKRIPKPARELLIEHDLQQTPERLIARKLRVPIGTVWSRVSAARKKFAVSWHRMEIRQAFQPSVSKSYKKPGPSGLKI